MNTVRQDETDMWKAVRLRDPTNPERVLWLVWGGGLWGAGTRPYLFDPLLGMPDTKLAAYIENKAAKGKPGWIGEVVDVGFTAPGWETS